MKHIILFLFSTQILFAKTYFQQQVNYKIDVRLNDVAHTLHASETIEYTNNSTDTLTFIYFHLWANAYQKNSALDKQMLNDGDSKLHFAKEKDKGFIDSLNFTNNTQKLRWEYDAKHHDICKVYLTNPLLPNKSIQISTPFFVKLPSAKISRLGHIEQFYAITQWYPKPAVYDGNGWNQMPYLNQGEFYSEFGSFDVNITLPENYVVGATGDLQTQSEIDLLNSKANDSIPTKKKDDKIKLNAFPSSSAKFKTIKYTQQNVHDFGWFADKRFVVRKSEIKLPNTGNTVATWAMFTPQNAKSWKNGTKYINDALYYYSKWNGDYPYKQCTAIDGTVSAGGGMEYPNVTIINSTTDTLQMDIVITHEVGHNWFYGILGSNERLHPWMDEGINSFNELRYAKTKYPNEILSRQLTGNKIPRKIIGLLEYKNQYFYHIFYNALAVNNVTQPIELKATAFTPINYGSIVYQKTAICFEMLQDFLGYEMFDKCMHNYFDKWKYKHPQPEDIRAVFEATTGKNLSWFFDEVINTDKKVDYKIKNVKYDDVKKEYVVKIKNNKALYTPIKISTLDINAAVKKYWFTNSDSTNTLRISSDKNLTTFIIDSARTSLDINRRNNFYRIKRNKYFNTDGYIKGFLGLTNPERKSLFVLPVVGFNTATPIQFGLLFCNKTAPLEKFSFVIMPMIAPLNYAKVTGTTKFNYNFYPSKIFRRISVGLYSKMFNYGSLKVDREEYFEVYGKYVEFIYKTNLKSSYSGGFTFREVNTNGLAMILTKNNLYRDVFTELKFFNNINYRLLKIETNLVGQILPKYFLRNKVIVETKVKYNYYQKRYVKARFFAGKLFNSKSREVSFSNTNQYSSEMYNYGFLHTGNNDYLFDDTYIDRSGTSNQTYINDGGLRNRIPAFGYVPNMIAGSFSFNVLNSKLLELYVDFARSYNANFARRYIFPVDYNLVKKKNYIAFATGISVAIIPDYFEVYIPLFLGNTNQKFILNRKLLYITFQLNISNMNLFNITRKLCD